MVEQLAPQGWSPVDNIPSLNLVSVLCLSTFPLRFYDRGTIHPPTLFPTCDYHFDTTKYQQKSDSKNGMIENEKKSIMT